MLIAYHARDDLAEDDVSVVEPGCLLGGDEELGSVSVFASVGHGQPPGSIVLQLEVLIGKTLSVDAQTLTSSVWFLNMIL